MKLSDIMKNESNKLDDILQKIDEIEISKYLYSEHDFLYNDNHLFIEYFYSDGEDKEILKKKIKDTLQKYWKYFENKEYFCKSENGMYIEIKQKKHYTDESEWSFCVESDDSNFYFEINQKI